MKITINKDFEESFPNEFYSGFTFGQCIAAAAGLLFSVAIVWMLHKYFGIPVVECTYIAIPFMIPFLAIGFFKYQKQSLKDILGAMNYHRKTKRLLFEAEEYPRGKERVFSVKNEIQEQKRRRKPLKKKTAGGGESYGSH